MSSSSIRAPLGGLWALALAAGTAAAIAMAAGVAAAMAAAPAAAAAAAPPTAPAVAGPNAGAATDVFPYKVAQTTLDNGLKIIVIPYDSPGTIAYFTVVRTGARDEVEPGHSGFAHLFEHLMFRGTARYPQARATEILKVMGADANASTWDDFTEYHAIGPTAELETMMDMESDRFKSLSYSEDVFRTEALAVLGEYNKGASNPALPLEEKLRDLAFTRHPYKHTALGFLADIKAMPGYYQFSIAFHDRFYRPENCTLLVVGDAQPQQVFSLAKRFYGDWRRGYQPTSVPPEPPQREGKAGRVDWPNPTHPYLGLAYHIPAFSTASVDSAALDLIAQLLFSESAPLYQELVNDKQWVDFVQGSAEQHRDPYLFTIMARTRSPELTREVRAAIDRHVALLKEQPVDAGRLERIKSHLRYAFALGLNTPMAVAFEATRAIALAGEIESINRNFEQYQKVTPADIRRLAREVFRPENQTVVVLEHPAGRDAKPAVPPPPAGANPGGGSHE